MMVVSFSMAYRSFRGGSGRLDTHLDTPPSINRRHPDSCLARVQPPAPSGGDREGVAVSIPLTDVDSKSSPLEDVELAPLPAWKSDILQLVKYTEEDYRKWKAEDEECHTCLRWADRQWLDRLDWTEERYREWEAQWTEEE